MEELIGQRFYGSDGQARKIVRVEDGSVFYTKGLAMQEHEATTEAYETWLETATAT